MAAQCVHEPGANSEEQHEDDGKVAQNGVRGQVDLRKVAKKLPYHSAELLC
jgi:hypothetical protein